MVTNECILPQNSNKAAISSIVHRYYVEIAQQEVQCQASLRNLLLYYDGRSTDMTSDCNPSSSSVDGADKHTIRIKNTNFATPASRKIEFELSEVLDNIRSNTHSLSQITIGIPVLPIAHHDSHVITSLDHITCSGYHEQDASSDTSGYCTDKNSFLIHEQDCTDKNSSPIRTYSELPP